MKITRIPNVNRFVNPLEIRHPGKQSTENYPSGSPVYRSTRPDTYLQDKLR